MSKFPPDRKRKAGRPGIVNNAVYSKVVFADGRQLDHSKISFSKITSTFMSFRLTAI
jgi:hypothetical protein